MDKNDKSNLNVELVRAFYSKNKADKILRKLNNLIEYDQNVVVKLYGKTYNIPRKQCAFGDTGVVYKYSGHTSYAKEWPQLLKNIKQDIEKQTKLKFNFCLVNCYENGNNYIGYHKDDEKELGKNPCIVSLSFGVSRKFLLKPDNKQYETISLVLGNGDLVVMKDPTNKYWYHSVPKQKLVTEKRINLTFRNIV